MTENMEEDLWRNFKNRRMELWYRWFRKNLQLPKLLRLNYAKVSGSPNFDFIPSRWTLNVSITSTTERMTGFQFISRCHFFPVSPTCQNLDDQTDYVNNEVNIVTADSPCYQLLRTRNKQAYRNMKLVNWVGMMFFLNYRKMLFI